jgi:hypothetical protein
MEKYRTYNIKQSGSKYDLGEPLYVDSDGNSWQPSPNLENVEIEPIRIPSPLFTPNLKSLEFERSAQEHTFTIMDISTIIPTKIIVSQEDAPRLTVQWLLEQYFKKQLKNPRFDMANVGCLRTRNQELNYDYLLTKKEARLSSFPKEITLETYHCVPSIQDEGFSAFQCIGLLGSGSFGNVLAVRRKQSGEIFAMKAIAKEKFQKHQAEVYVFEEKNILIDLNNPYVVVICN